VPCCFEIICAAQDVDESAVAPPGCVRPLGFEIAGYSPFWSVLAHQGNDALGSSIAKAVNEHGLLRTRAKATEWLRKYRVAHPEDADLDLLEHLTKWP
jgi:hypothetical protein